MIAIHDPDVAFTDLGLAILGAYLGWRLVADRAGGALTRSGAVMMFALAGAAFWGGVFHAFFPAQTATPAGFVVWLAVAFSIVVVATVLLELGMALLAPRVPARVRKGLAVIYAASFAAVVMLVNQSFSTIVRFYGPALILILVAAVVQAVRARSTEWTFVAAGFALSSGATLLQQARVAIHPQYFDHNALYHVLQGGALMLLYLGFRRASLPSARASMHAS